MPWISNVWPNFYLRSVAGLHSDHINYSFSGFKNNRPKSFTETRLCYWMPIILGAKGLMIYKGPTGTEDGVPLPPDPAVAPRVRLGGELWERNYEGGIHFGQGLLTNPLVGPVTNAMIDDEAIGGDWMMENDPSSSPQYFYHDVTTPFTGYQSVVDNLNNNAAHPNSILARRLYVGMRSARHVLDEVSHRLDFMRTTLGRAPIAPTTPAALHPLMNLRLQGWWGKGFGMINVEHPDNAGCLGRVFSLAGSIPRLKTRHPRRGNSWTDVPTENPGSFDYEPYDSSFVDLTLHAFAGEEDIQNRWVIGVLNRRTDPRMMAHGAAYNSHGNEGWDFATYSDWTARMAAHPEDKYAQRGSREITIPFSYERLDAQGNSDGRYRLLRLRELGGGLDTIIGQDKEITLNFLPAEGRMFQVDVVESDVPHDNRGWLSHNTQRKAVVFPEIERGPGAQPVYTDVQETRPYCGAQDEDGNDTMRQVVRVAYGNRFRYHVVYHRRNINGNGIQDDTGPLTVFYRRSALLTTDTTNAASTNDGGMYNPAIVWEEEIALSRFIVDGPVSTLPVINPQLSCGYPSIVVRHDPQRQEPYVYVVYACEGPEANAVWICEAQLRAESNAVVQKMFYENQTRSMILDKMVTSNVLCALDRLNTWGTPVINASEQGNYYAWSDKARGIVYGFKTPSARRFTDLVPGGAHLGAMGSVRVGNANVMQAQYPTMHSYSKLFLGERDCSLAWQEGPTNECALGKDIYLTRLRWVAQTGVLSRELSSTPMVTFGGALLQPALGNTVVCVSCGTETGHGQGSQNAKPTLYRNLSEFDDSQMTNFNPLQNVGYANHKADRLMWENIGPLFEEPIVVAPLRYIRLAKKDIDFTERCFNRLNEQGFVQSTGIWASPVAYVYDDFSNLRNPELIQGEQKTLTYTNGITDAEHAAQSWKYSDTGMIASFNSEGGVFQTPHVYHMNFMAGMFSNALQWDIHHPLAGYENVVTDVTLETLAGAGINSGVIPHVAARHNIVQQQSLLKDRRFFENVDYTNLVEIRPGYVRAPWISRSVRGFFRKNIDSVMQTERVYTGFRSGDLEAFVSEISLGGKEVMLSSDMELQPQAKNTVQRLHSAWMLLPKFGDLQMRTVAKGLSATRTKAWIERQSDGMNLELPVFNVAGAVLGERRARSTKHEWTLLSDTTDTYRIVIECTDPSAGVVQDVELHAGVSDMMMSKITAVNQENGTDTHTTRILDLHRMRMITPGAQDKEAGITAYPTPASDEVVLLVQGLHDQGVECELVITDITGHCVLTSRIATGGRINAAATVRVSDLVPGVYSARITGSSLTGTIVVSR